MSGRNLYCTLHIRLQKTTTNGTGGANIDGRPEYVMKKRLLELELIEKTYFTMTGTSVLPNQRT